MCSLCFKNIKIRETLSTVPLQGTLIFKENFKNLKKSYNSQNKGSMLILTKKKLAAYVAANIPNTIVQL